MSDYDPDAIFVKLPCLDFAHRDVAFHHRYSDEEINALHAGCHVAVKKDKKQNVGDIVMVSREDLAFEMEDTSYTPFLNKDRSKGPVSPLELEKKKDVFKRKVTKKRAVVFEKNKSYKKSYFGYQIHMGVASACTAFHASVLMEDLEKYCG